MATTYDDPFAVGALVLDIKGEVTFATGFARERVVQQRILKRYHLDERRRGMMALSGEPQLITSFRSGENATLFFIQHASSKSTLFNSVINVDFTHAVFDYCLNDAY